MAFETMKRIAPLLGALTFGSGCERPPQEDIARLTCAELKARIKQVATAPNDGHGFPGKAMYEDGKRLKLRDLNLVARSKGCE